MSQINYKKLFNSFPYSQIERSLEIFEIGKDINVLADTIKHWRTDLIVNGVELCEVKINRGIFAVPIALAVQHHANSTKYHAK